VPFDPSTATLLTPETEKPRRFNPATAQPVTGIVETAGRGLMRGVGQLAETAGALGYFAEEALGKTGAGILKRGLDTALPGFPGLASEVIRRKYFLKEDRSEGVQLFL